MSLTRSAVIYARISRDPGQTFAGVERQVNDASARIKDMPGTELNSQIDGSPIDRKHPGRGHWPPGVLVDNDISAARGARNKRPEYNRLISYAQGSDVQVIVCAAQDRLWRNVKQAADGMEDIKDTGVRLVFTKSGEEMDLSQSETKFRAGLMSLLASWFTDDIKDKQQNAARESAEAGAYHGARPFGFTLMHLNNPDDPAAGTHEPAKAGAGERVKCPGCGGRASSKARTLVRREDEAEAVVMMYALAAAIPDAISRDADADVMSPYKICQYLDGHEITGPDGTRISRPAIRTAQDHTWEQVGVQGLLVILRAKRNIGKREWSAHWDGGKRPPGAIIKGNWPGIVHESVFDRVQRKLDTRHKPRTGGNDPAHLLTGDPGSYCATCGSSLRVHRVGGKRRYACSAWKQDGCVSFEADVADAEVTRYLFKWLARNSLLTKTLEHTGNADLKTLYDKRDRLQEQRDGVDNDYADGVYLKPDGTKDRERYRKQCSRKDGQITANAAEIDAMLAGEAAGSGGKRVGTRSAFRAQWRGDGLSDDERLAVRRTIVSQFIDKVVIYPAGAGNKPDPRLVHIYPGKWAAGLDDAQPPAAPDPVAFTSKGKITACLSARSGEWLTRQEVADGAGITENAAHKALTDMGAAGTVSREWRRRGGKRACFMFSAASGESWGPRTRNAPDGQAGGREKVKSFMEATPTGWFTVKEIAEGSGAGGEPHVSKIVSQLVDAGFAQRRRAPLPRKNVRVQFSINGR